MPRRAIRLKALHVAALLLLPISLACAPRLISLKLPASTPSTEAAGIEVVTAVAGGRDPLPVDCGDLAFAGVARAIGAHAAAAVEPWAARHRAARPGGWQLLVELTRSRADRQNGVLSVELETRVTLRARAGLEHLAQTRGYCKAVDTGPTHEPAAVASQCVERLASDLADWLEGVSP